MSFLNHQTLVLSPQCSHLESFVRSVPEIFSENKGEVIHKGRNELRKIDYNGETFVIKSFHRPNLINRFVYGVFRPSKAMRSYNNALIYLKIGVGTPRPVGYLNIRRHALFDRSYYITYASECKYTYEELFKRKFDYEDEVIKEIARVTARLHDNGYAHKDYGRGNILFCKTDKGIKIEIVDLNRMYVGPLDMKAGCKNFERLPATPHMHEVLAYEYAKARGFDPKKCHELIVAYRSVQPGKIDNLY